MSAVKFPEDSLTLLGKVITDETPLTYHERVRAYYAEAKPRGAKPRPATFKGKIITKPTKKIRGVYSVTYAGKVHTFPFERNKFISEEKVTELATTLGADSVIVKKFLLSKKFSLDAVSVSE